MTDPQFEHKADISKGFTHFNDSRIIRRKLLTQFTKVVNVLDLLGGMLCITGAGSFLLNTIKDSLDSGPVAYDVLFIAIAVQLAAVLFFVMNLLLLLGHKLAIRLAIASLTIFIPIALLFSFILGFMAFTILLVLAAHVPFYMNLWKVRKYWETASPRNSDIFPGQ
ncbi:hypothetical protein CLV59_106127 [Chitinophaga dinghuensis]|uniref:Uncharacterized protein n=1 Tax=Chitinophaga dinghuensis TaxID=1539050 RepID=A0A327VSP3_9BACT|nr:hypothetical protein [Chitinophaga dinghuensis]RAJ79067.1 hypothetical protein CLV59_106127 [Chitinophaga dinghuensis]